jgi:AcrR family transcriptional regulator
VLAEKGVEGFSLRETSRRAGVSPAAPKHHFPDTRALLTALAAIAFGKLADALAAADQAAGDDLAARIRAQGLAYVGFALSDRALFELMWRSALLDLSDAALLPVKERAFAILDGALRGEHAPPLPLANPQMTRTMACWSIVHGIARLALDGAFGHHDDAEIAIHAIVPEVLSIVVGAPVAVPTIPGNGG